jgi:sulfur carrier protein
MLQILLNGEPHEIDARTTVHHLLDRNGYADRRVAVEINREIVPRSAHGERLLREGDQVEIVHALGGG